MGFKTYIVIFLMMFTLHSSYGQINDLNFNPSYKFVKGEEPAPFPALAPTNKEFINLMDSIVNKYLYHFNQEYDSALFFDVTFKFSNDSLFLNVYKSDFQAYDLFKTAYHEYPKTRPFGSFILNGILFIVHNESSEIIHQYFNVASSNNILTTKRIKLTEPGVHSVHQIVRFDYYVTSYEFSLLHMLIHSYNLSDIFRKKR